MKKVAQKQPKGKKQPDSRFGSEDAGYQQHEILQNECADCFRLYEEDTSEEWIQCTNESCGVCSHANCLERCGDAYICVICNTCFI